MNKFLQLLAVIFTLQGCAPSKPINKVDKLLILPVYSNVGYIFEWNQKVTDSTLSEYISRKYENLIKQNLPENVSYVQLQVRKDSITEIGKAFEYIVKMSDPQESRKKVITVPKLLLDILDEHSVDFGIGVVATGFIRTENNKIESYAAGRGTYLFSLGTIDFRAYETFSTVRVFIIDRQNKNLRYYNKSRHPDWNPSDSLAMKRQIHHLLMSYFQNGQ